MSDRRPPYDRRATKPLPRAELAPIASDDVAPETRPALDESVAIARASEDDVITLMPCPTCKGNKAGPCSSCSAAGMVAPRVAAGIARGVECPLCCGVGHVAPEIAVTFDEIIASAKEQA